MFELYYLHRRWKNELYNTGEHVAVPSMFYHFNFTPQELLDIQQRFNIKIIPFLSERFVDLLFKANYKKMGFDRISSLGSPDYIAYRNDVRCLVELEVYPSLYNHNYQVDYIVCLDDPWDKKCNAQIIMIKNVLGLKEIIGRKDLERYLFTHDSVFRRYYEEFQLQNLANKMKSKQIIQPKG